MKLPIPIISQEVTQDLEERSKIEQELYLSVKGFSDEAKTICQRHRDAALEDPPPSSSLSDSGLSTDPTKIYRRIMDLDQWLLAVSPRTNDPIHPRGLFRGERKTAGSIHPYPLHITTSPLFSFAIVDRQYHGR